MQEELYLELRTLAEESHRTVPGYIRQILKRYLRYRTEHKEDMDPHWIIR